MTALELTSAVTALANALACKLTADEIALLAAILVQLGDTLATIATVQSVEESKKACSENNKQRFP